jgi:NAD(P)-dependent dehydrogenase (short-subunit alcohol dehydrogenase family)
MSGPLAVIAGVGKGSGTGAATARLLARNGYRVALIARDAEALKTTADEINASGTGGEAAAFPVTKYDYNTFEKAFADIKQHWPGAPLRVALWNVAHGVWKPFLDVTEDDIRNVVETDVVAGFGFARQVITTFKGQELNELGKRGTLIFTGATAATRGNVLTSAFAAGKFGVRALSQSLAKEFGKQNIHVAHAIIDGAILTNRLREMRKDDPAFLENEDARLHPDAIAKAYLSLIDQERSAWTWELDLRPAHEKW